MKTLIVILGPTGVGKTDLSIDIAIKLNAEILSSDSRQIYKELKIGTAVPEDEQLAKVKHHFIQHKSIEDYYNVSHYENEAINKLNVLFKTNDYALLVGGSGMYIDAVCSGIDDIPDIDMELRESLIKREKEEGLESIRFELKHLDPEFYDKVDLKNTQRVLRALEVCLQTGKPFSSFRTGKTKSRDFNIIKIGLNIEREKLYNRINQRVDIMVNEGLVEEARKVFPKKHLNALKTVGYRELFDSFDEKHSIEKAIELIKRNSRHYAKRQLSWFSRDKEIQWFKPSSLDDILKFITER